MSGHLTGGSEAREIQDVMDDIRETVDFYEVLTGREVSQINMTPYLYGRIMKLGSTVLDRDVEELSMIHLGGIPINAVVDSDLLDREPGFQWEIIGE